ncbi:MAG: S1C family serine protease [Actinomycetes bacterium]
MSDEGWQPPAPAHSAPAHAAPAHSAEDLGLASNVQRRRVVRGLFLVVAVLVPALLAGFTGGWVAGRQNGGSISLVTPGSQSTARPPESVAGVAAAVLPSVVSIETRTANGQGTGSGFVLRPDGYILTNNHVVAEAAEAGGDIRVVFPDGSHEAAKVVGRTTAYDLAVLRVGRQDLPALQLGDSESVVVGDPVIAVGAPLGLDSTVTTGIVSALNRPVAAGEGQENAFINAIQTDAAINPGNSGGPLVDMQGRVIGINSAIARLPGSLSPTGGNIGLGFAIPSEQAARTAAQLIATGKATYPVVGVLLDRGYDGEGVRVATQPLRGVPPVTPDGPAARAGIKPGDVIVGFEGRPVTEPDQLIVAIRAQTPGDTVTLDVRSGGEQRRVDVVLDEADSDS